jgi:hypothetical protein
VRGRNRYISTAYTFFRKMLRGLDNHEMNAETIHPFSVKRSDLVKRRGAGLPLTSGQYDMWIGEISIGTPPKTMKGEFLPVSF